MYDIIDLQSSEESSQVTLLFTLDYSSWEYSSGRSTTLPPWLFFRLGERFKVYRRVSRDHHDARLRHQRQK